MTIFMVLVWLYHRRAWLCKFFLWINVCAGSSFFQIKKATGNSSGHVAPTLLFLTEHCRRMPTPRCSVPKWCEPTVGPEICYLENRTCPTPGREFVGSPKVGLASTYGLPRTLVRVLPKSRSAVTSIPCLLFDTPLRWNTQPRQISSLRKHVSDDGRFPLRMKVRRLSRWFHVCKLRSQPSSSITWHNNWAANLTLSLNSRTPSNVKTAGMGLPL